jgi:hypothetical protein
MTTYEHIFFHMSIFLLCGKMVGKYHSTYNHMFMMYMYIIYITKITNFVYMICSSLDPQTSSQCLSHQATQPFVNKTFATFPFILLIVQQLRNPKIDNLIFKFVRMKQIKT